MQLQQNLAVPESACSWVSNASSSSRLEELGRAARADHAAETGILFSALPFTQQSANTKSSILSLLQIPDVERGLRLPRKRKALG